MFQLERFCKIVKRSHLLVSFFIGVVFTFSIDKYSSKVYLLSNRIYHNDLFLTDSNLFDETEVEDVEMRNMLLGLKKSLYDKKGFDKVYNTCLSYAKALKQKNHFEKALLVYYEMEKILASNPRNNLKNFEYDSNSKEKLLDLYHKMIHCVKKVASPERKPFLEVFQKSLNFITTEIANYNMNISKENDLSNKKIKIPAWMGDLKVTYILLESAEYYDSINKNYALTLYTFVTKLISDFDTLGVVYSHISAINYENRNYEEAIKHLEIANKMNIKNNMVKFSILNNLAMCYEKTGDTRNTVITYKEMLSRKYKKYLSDDYSMKMKLLIKSYS